MACQHIGPPPCAGQRADLDAAPRKLHLRLALEREERDRRHEVIVQVEPGRITAIGLTPLGTPAYGLRHEPGGLEVENRVGRHLGYEPRRVYDAIVHAFLARTPGPDDPPVSAIVTRERDGVHVVNAACGYRARLVVVSDGPA